MVQLRRALLHVARLRAAAGDVLGALAVHEAAGPRRRLPRQRVGRRQRSGPAHQDVHRDHRRGLRHDPPRAGSQLLPARLPQAADALPQQRQRRLPRSDRRRHRAVGHARLPGQGRPAGQGAGRRGRPRVPDADGARQGRVPAVRPRSSISGAGRCSRGEITPDEYNAAWWELRQQVPGRRRSRGRAPSDDFDPGAKYHVPANTPYTRYFLAHILQFQFHRAMCREAGYTGPLHRCSIYGNKQVGRASWRRCWRWARAGRGRTRSRR